MLGILEFWTKEGKDYNKVSENTETIRSDRGDNRAKVGDIFEVEDMETSKDREYLEEAWGLKECWIIFLCNIFILLHWIVPAVLKLVLINNPDPLIDYVW